MVRFVSFGVWSGGRSVEGGVFGVVGDGFVFATHGCEDVVPKGFGVACECEAGTGVGNDPGFLLHLLF